jgi:hypothetical protein
MLYLNGKRFHRLLSECRYLRKRDWGQHLWARGYWVASSGTVTDEVWEEYIKSQRSPEPDVDFHVVLSAEWPIDPILGRKRKLQALAGEVFAGRSPRNRKRWIHWRLLA